MRANIHGSFYTTSQKNLRLNLDIRKIYDLYVWKCDKLSYMEELNLSFILKEL